MNALKCFDNIDTLPFLSKFCLWATDLTHFVKINTNPNNDADGQLQTIKNYFHFSHLEGKSADKKL